MTMTMMMPRIQLHEKTKSAEVLAQLDAVPLRRVYQAGQRALMRLHLFSTGRIHEEMVKLADKARGAILREADKDGLLDGAAVLKIQRVISEQWADVFEEMRTELLREMEIAASIPFGVLAVVHERLVTPEVEKFRGAGSSDQLGVISGPRPRPLPKLEEGEFEEGRNAGVFNPQIRVLLSAAEEHLYGGGLNLSGRLWKLDREAKDGINQVLLNGLSKGDSAWNIAKDLEQFLGGNADCARWTSTRLYQRTKTDIARGDTGGLIRGNACQGQSVAYNALRLARTEIQKAHALATDKVMAAQPWVKKEQVHLSGAHPEPDICDEVVTSGEKSQGVYEVGEIELPLHPNCLCYKTAVLMDEKEFTSKLRGWMQGTEQWAGMDEYERLVGGDVSVNLMPEAWKLAVWMSSDELDASSG